MIFGKYINRYYWKYGWLLLAGIAALVTVDYLQLLIPNMYQMVINGLDKGYVVVDGVQQAFDMDFALNKICIPLAVIILIMVLGKFSWRVTFFTAATKTESQLRSRMFAHAAELSQEYYQFHKVGDLMSLYTNDLDTIQECFGWGIMQFFDAFFLGVLAIIKMWMMDYLLTLLSLIPMALLFAAASVVGHYMSKKWEYRQECFSKLSDFAQESFSGIAVIKAFVKEAKELLTFQKLNMENEKANIEFTKMSVLMRILVTTFVESVMCIILGYGGYLVYKGEFNAGQLMEFMGYFNAIVWPVMAVSELIDMTSRGKASLKRVSEMLDETVKVKDNAKVTNLTDAKGKIEMRNLTFQYPGTDVAVLKNVSFTIYPGESVGIVGRTGSGKTTLVDLIVRSYNVPDGTLFIDDKDINTISISSVRAACAYVPQDNFLFSDSIERNIAFSSEFFEKEQVTDAAILADIHDNITEFKAGYQTVLGERGVTVSGGQKQRISIARALMKNAPILILDDSVSAVDTKTEKTILENLEKTRRKKTTILSAHRISTIEKMKKILFLENGCITAVGTHQELYAHNAEYKKMVDLQKLEEEGELQNA